MNKKDITQKILSIIGNFNLSEAIQLKELTSLYMKQEQEIERLNNIIKEVREYINSIDEIEVRYLDKEALYRNHITEYQIQEQLKKDKTLEGHFVKVNKYYLLEILEKENK